MSAIAETQRTIDSGPIHRPDAPEHFMVIRPAEGPITLRVGAAIVASSSGALVVQEVGRSIMPPVVYIPFEDVAEGVLHETSKRTHCPLKGEASYYDLINGDLVIPEAAWSYTGVLDFDPRLAQLSNMISFDARYVRID